MKKIYKFTVLLFLTVLVFQSCEDFDDVATPTDLQVNNFIWKGLNLYYLWQADVPNLSDDYLQNQKSLNSFLNGYSNPSNLFQDLLNKPVSKFPGKAIDRFSVIFSDYTQLEGILSGTTKNNGVEYSWYYKDATKTDVIGVVSYILPNSDASTKEIFRGAIFYAINGETLNSSNYRSLLGNDSYTLNLADYDGGKITPNSKSVNLTKTVLSENPVYISKVIENGNHKIGYLMYNGFYPNYEAQLNDAFGQLKSEGITEFVLDLRYNSGGSVATATRLASMITGQFNGQVFAKQQWNAKVESYYKNPSSLYNYFTTTINNNARINSLNLSKIYILTSKSTASASELIINGLKPYINVVQIGDVTTGKNVGSITLYDSPTYKKVDVNPNHRYAMQPLVLKIVNKVGFGDYLNGLEPDKSNLIEEKINNLGILGDSNEPLLNTAINRILGGGRKSPQKPVILFERVIDNEPISQMRNEMYVDEVPEGFLK